MSHEGLWTFYNSKNPVQEIQVLGLASARVFARLLRIDELTTWKVKEQNNKSVKECLELFSTPSPQASQASLSVVSKEVKEMRRHSRQEARLSIALYKGKNVFNGFTKNISLGGLAIEGQVPQEFCVDSCKVVIDSGDNLLRIETTAKILNSNEKLTRLVFEADLAHKVYERLMEFIKAQDDLHNKRKIKIS